MKMPNSFGELDIFSGPMRISNPKPLAYFHLRNTRIVVFKF